MEFTSRCRQLRFARLSPPRSRLGGLSSRQSLTTSKRWDCMEVVSRSSFSATMRSSPTTNDCMKKPDLKKQVSEAIRACQDKKAEEIAILELEKGSGAFTDYFVVCSGANPRQIQAIADEVEGRLEKDGMRPNNIEGYK